MNDGNTVFWGPEGPAAGANSVSLFDFMTWAKQAIDGEKLRLPALQRGALWDHRQILDLWDSLLAGMPVGMFYLIKARRGGRTFLGNKLLRDTPGQALDLLDGQQRLRAMMLGFMHPKKTGACLWVDTETTGSASSKVQLFLTTRGRPFGWTKDREKLTWKDRNRLSEKLRVKHKITDFEPDNRLFDLFLDATDRPPAPFAAPNARPLHEILDPWSCDVDPSAADAKPQQTESGEDVGAIRNPLTPEFEVLRSSTIVVFLMPSDKVNEADGDKWLLDWFGRTGRGGTPLSIEEQNYCTYKQHEPEIVEAVEAVRSKGRIMSETGIVETAIRVANATREDASKRGFGVADPEKFKSWLMDDAGFKASLEKLLSPVEGDAGPGVGAGLAWAFEALSRMVIFDRQSPQNEPHGLPRFMIASLPRELLQILVLWLVKRPDQADKPEVRAEMIRLALYWSLCVGNQGRALTAAFGVISDCTMGSGDAVSGFPGHAIYRAIASHQSTNFPLIAPSDLAAFLRRDGSHEVLPEWSFLFDQPLGHFADWRKGIRHFANIWWSTNINVLKWLQAKYLDGRLPNYDPLAIEEEDTHFDLDHIIPQDNFYYTSCSPASESVKTNFTGNRLWFANSVGNKCWLASSDNRAAGNRSTLEKIAKLWDRHGGEIATLRLGGATEEELRQVWAESSSGERSWSPERVAALRKVVIDRVLRLYDEFWNEAGFSAWADPPRGLDPGASSAPEQATGTPDENLQETVTGVPTDAIPGR